MTTLQISVFGISCFAEPRRDGQGNPIDAFKKRLLLPTDTISDTAHPPHIPFVEILENDFYTNPSTIPGLSSQYTRDGGVYRRFELYGQRLWIDNIDTTQGWSVSPLFDDRVAKMRRVLPTLNPNPNYRCFDQSPPPDLVSGYFDINYGRLTVGKIDPLFMTFNPTNLWPSRRLAVAAVLELAVTSALPQFRIEYNGETPGGGTNVIRLKQDATGIAIGNLPPKDLTGTKPTTDDPSHDFLMFYKLADPVPSGPPLPIRGHGIDVACSPTGWP